ncbi:ABC transporter ATP-binding protein [Clostridium vincentii]|uniref:Spermidine/putrescine import ATP-binding protein PotA n=1 Tax=Clostridium vincentii TaxID=52704 RepID=A0A2T0BAZ3_9CLOT|nr:ABC transporter ATP-binding protein [Clostridium vincentii]PRR81012.1 Spermidine/putrescine import ATP-binding protein PotA [Clostridium vincentii]
MGKKIVIIADVNKIYGDNHVVKNLNLQVNEGEFLTMLGPSGCGKTTTLRMIAGFEEPTDGDIFVEDVKVQDKEPYDRQVNTVFQSYALFPHMNIYDNVAFGLTMKKVPKAEIKTRVSEMLELVQLKGYEKRKPDQLSGGQKQRVAIARALINRPKVLLLDEPLGALDLKLRKQMQVELKRLQKKLGITFIYVTHDQEEALTMSDRIAIMNGGILEQLGTPAEIYERPASKFVADFIGESNIFYGTIKESIEDKLKVTIESGEVEAIAAGFEKDSIVYISVRPEKIEISETPVKESSILGIVKEHVYVGSIIKTIVVLPSGQEIKMNKLPGMKMVSVDTKVYVYWKVEDAVVIESKSEEVFSIIDNPDISGAAK